MKIEQLGLPQFQTKPHKPITAEEVFADSLELRDKINDIIIKLYKLEALLSAKKSAKKE